MPGEKKISYLGATVADGEGHGVLCAPDGDPCADKAASVCLTTAGSPRRT
ncbi:hypothetical protein [Streptomyces flavofungini]